MKNKKLLGERALKLGMPFEAYPGLSDGAVKTCDGENARTGVWRIEEWGDENNKTKLVHHRVLEKSWPDFSDPVTEAWLVAWASEYAQQFTSNAFILQKSGKEWIVFRYDTHRGEPYATGKTRAEAWILALEKLKEG